MIIQRIASAIKRQDWFQVLIEVIIVIVGIFLGLQVQAWYEARTERADEREYLVRLHQDFSQSIANNKIRMDRVYQMLQDIKIISDSLESCTLTIDNRDSFASGMFGMGKFIPLTLTGTAIDELKSTGKFQIIQNAEIRDEISLNMTEIVNQTNIGGNVYAGILPHLHFIEKQYSYDVEDTDPDFPFPPLTWSKLNLDFEKFCQTDEIKNSISQIHLYMNGFSARAYQAMEQQRKIRTMLEVELERFR